MLLPRILLLLILISPVWAQCSGGNLYGQWTPLVDPKAGRIWDMHGGVARSITLGNNPLEHVIGNSLIMGLTGTEGCNSVDATMTMDDIPLPDGHPRPWIPDRLDRGQDFQCAFQQPAPFPDVYSFGVGLRASALHYVMAVVGSGLPFQYRPERQDGGYYSLLYIVEDGKIVGTPLIIPPVAPKTPVRFKVYLVTDSDGDHMDAVTKVGSTFYAVTERLDPTNHHGVASAGWFHMPPQSCIDKGERVINLLQFFVR